MKADFKSVRGPFKFGRNHHPIQDLYAMRVVKDDSGNMDIKTISKVLTNHADAYGGECKL